MNAWKKKVVNSESGSYLKVSLGGGGGISPLLGSKMALNVKNQQYFCPFRPILLLFQILRRGGGGNCPENLKVGKRGGVLDYAPDPDPYGLKS